MTLNKYGETEQILYLNGTNLLKTKKDMEFRSTIQIS